MTDAELELKAKMYETHTCGTSNPKLRKAYIDGYKDGSHTASERILENWCKDPLSPCGFLLEREAEISRLKNIIEKTTIGIKEE